MATCMMCSYPMAPCYVKSQRLGFTLGQPFKELPPHKQAEPAEYVPFGSAGSAAIELVKDQARMIREALEGQYRSRSWNSNLWAQVFWQQITSQHEAVAFHPALVGLLQGHGWVGATTSAPPRAEQLIK